MARLVWSEGAFDDLLRLADFLAQEDPAAGEATIDLIASAVDVLSRHPLIGRRASGELRELVISRGRSGYVALYEYQERHDRIVVHALRHQREAGFND